MQPLLERIERDETLVADGAMGIEDANNFFAVYYDGTNMNVAQVTDGGQPVVRTSASWSPTNQTDYTIYVEVNKPSANYEVAVKEGANTLMSAYNISQHGYDGGNRETADERG